MIKSAKVDNLERFSSKSLRTRFNRAGMFLFWAVIVLPTLLLSMAISLDINQYILVQQKLSQLARSSALAGTYQYDTSAGAAICTSVSVTCPQTAQDYVSRFYNTQWNTLPRYIKEATPSGYPAGVYAANVPAKPGFYEETSAVLVLIDYTTVPFAPITTDGVGLRIPGQVQKLAYVCVPGRSKENYASGPELAASGYFPAEVSDPRFFANPGPDCLRPQ